MTTEKINNKKNQDLIDFLKEVTTELDDITRCAIGLEPISDPYITDDGATFEKAEIERYIGEVGIKSVFDPNRDLRIAPFKNCMVQKVIDYNAKLKKKIKELQDKEERKDGELRDKGRDDEERIRAEKNEWNLSLI